MTEPAPDVPVVTRRRVIAGATAIGVGGAVALLQGTRNRVAPPQVHPTSAPRASGRPTSRGVKSYSTREAYDAAEVTYRRTRAQHPGTSTNIGGTLAWGESPAVSSYLTMYRATGEVSYLDKLVDASQPVLAARDDRRGEFDYLGRSLPGWAAAEPYTVARLDLLDVAGAPAVQLATAATEERVLVDVRVGPDGLFELRVTGSSGLSETVRGLSLDPGHPRYVVSLLEKQYPGPAALTAVDLRPGPERDGILASAVGALMTAQRYVFAVHTGMIAAPLAQFAALLVREPGLRRRYAGSAAELLRAAEAAVYVHESDWRRLSDKSGIYTFAVGAPVRADGTYLPHNQYLAIARCLVQLHIATQDPLYKERATMMLNLFRSDLSADSAPIWPYYWSGSQPYRGFGTGETRSIYSPRAAPQRNAEDPSHGALDVDALVAGFDAGMNVPASVMPRLAATFLNRVVRRGSDGRWATAKRLGSTEDLPPGDLAAVRWIELARWDRRVYSTVAALFDQLQPVPREGQVLASVAQMVALR